MSFATLRHPISFRSPGGDRIRRRLHTLVLSIRTLQSQALYRQYRERMRYRSDLRRLLKVGRYMIEDVGLSYEQVVREATKPFWIR